LRRFAWRRGADDCSSHGPASWPRPPTDLFPAPWSPPGVPGQKRTCTCVSIAMHTLQRVHPVRNERARAFLQGWRN
jgi:hypothetical protein